MKTVFRFPAALILAVAFLASAHPVALANAVAQTTNVTGEWAFNVTTDQGGGTPTITFKQDGEKLTGTLDSVPKLYQTRDLTAAARQSAGRYGAALQRIL